jgi:hypothetical protein
MTSTEVVGASRNKWLPWLSVLLLIVGVGIGVSLGRVPNEDKSHPPDLATTSVTKMLADLAKAVKTGDATAIATFYAPSATFNGLSSGGVATGDTTIANDLVSLQKLGFFVVSSGTAIQVGKIVAQASIWAGGSGVVVFELGTDGKIVSQWILPSK